MKRFLLIIGLSISCLADADAQFVTQQFTGVVHPYGNGPGLYGDTAGTQITGSFTVNRADFNSPEYPGGTLYTTTLPNSDSVKISDGVNTMVVTSLTYVHIIPTFVQLEYCSNGTCAQLYVSCEQPTFGGTLASLPISFPSFGCHSGVAFTNSYTVYAIQIDIDHITGANQSKTSGNPSDQPGGCSCAEPVNLGTGSVFEEVTDYATAGPNALSFARFYNGGGDTNTLAESLGSKWRTNFDRYLRIAFPSVTAERDDGQEVAFTLQNGVWTSDSDVDVTLTNSGSSWTLTDHNDLTETYTTISSTNAQLMSSQSRNGYTQTLIYNGNQLTTVTDSYGRNLQFGYSNGLLQTVITPDNMVLSYGYTSSGLSPGVLDRLATVTYSTNPQTTRTTQTYLYENATLPFALTGITDENGNRYATWAYDLLGRAVSNYMGSSTTQANQTTIQYDDATGNRTVTNALGQSELYKFTTLQGIPKLTEIDRQATATTSPASRLITYDINGYVASQTDWDGNQIAFVNNTHGQPTRIVEAANTPQTRTMLIAYDPIFVHLPKQIARSGLTRNFAYDGNGNTLTRTDTDTSETTAPYSTNGRTRVSTFTWNSYGLLATAQTARTDLNAIAHYYYDSTFALSKITNPLGQSIQITSNTSGGRPQTVIDPNGVTTQLTYDLRERLTSRALNSTAGTLTISFGYDAAGNLIKTTLADGTFLMNIYDTAHRLTQMTDALGNYIKYTLDGLGDRTQGNIYTSTNLLQWQSSSSFDALGREYLQVAGAGQPTKRQLDGNGNVLTIEDGLNHTTTNTYDSLNRLATGTDANGGVTTPAYDTNDRITSLTDANGNTTSYVRDGFGDVIQQASPDSGLSIFHYDNDGDLTSKTDALGIVTNWTFDALDRPLTTTYPAHPAENVAYSYDQTGAGFAFGIGRLTGVTDAAGAMTRAYDERGNLISEKRVNGSTILNKGYSYDGASRMASMAYPDGTLVGYQRNVAGYLTTVTAKLPGASSTTTLASNLTHLPFGPMNGVTYGNGIAETWMFDASYRPGNISDALSGSTLQNLTYWYDYADNVQTISDSVNPANSQAFGYDVVNRLSTAI